MNLLLFVRPTNVDRSVTTEPNEVAARIHDRMPVILPLEAAKALLTPYAGAMIAYPVDKAVGSPKNDSPELIEEIEAEA